MLDNCSQGSLFVHEAVLKQLGVNGTITTSSVKILHGGKEFFVEVIQLYHREDLPDDKEEITTPQMITEWEYLMPVANEIFQSYLCIRLLIEVNCMNALKPIQVMAVESGGPYTCKTSLGLCTVGPIINGDSKGPVSCHRVTVKRYI